MLAIYKRELRSYFVSPIGYIFIAVFLCVSGIIFSMCTLSQGANSSVGTYFIMLLCLFIIVLPLLTMKLFADERKMRTEPLLLSSPISLAGMVVAKFLAAYTVFAATFLFSCLDFIALYEYGTPNTAILIGNSIGILLVGAACIAIGVFVSSLTESQLVAVLVTMVVLVVMMFINIFNQFIPFAWLRTALSWFAISSRYDTLAAGRFDFTAILYYVSIAGSFLLLTIRVFEKKRWH